MSFALALATAALSGYVALSWEILWFRIYGFVTGGSAPSFGVVLAFYLLGLAVGSLAVGAYCSERTARADSAQFRVPALLILVANGLGFLLVPFIAWTVQRGPFVWTLPAVAVVAGLLGTVLPLVSHFGIRPTDRVGQRLSYVYLANIVGSASGSLLTGFVLLDRLSLAHASLMIALVGVGSAALLLLASRLDARSALRWSLAIAGVSATLVGAAPALFDQLYEKLLFKTRYAPNARLAQVSENRSGVISVAENGTVFGGGVYDGGFNTDLVTNDRNLIIRAYALAALHPAPREVLMIGLGTGSWAQVVANNPRVERLTVVEINPGYVSLIRDHAEVSSLLANRKVDIVIDDGRRWLMAHPEQRFDAVVFNMTYHWRAHATELLSVEFLQLVRAHLKPGGLFYYNTTSSPHVQKTACTIFPNGFRIVNFMAVSDAPLQINRERWQAVLTEYKIDGTPVFDLARAADVERLQQVLRLEDPDRSGDNWFESCADILARTQTLPLVTDDNMVVEYTREWWQVP